MKLTLNWIKDFIDIKESPQEISEILTNLGLEVEGMNPLAKGLENIYVAKILNITVHPNASRLVLCHVTDGKETCRVVCGAKNMLQGDIVVLAKPGSSLPRTKKFPDGIKIERTKIRGVVSQGMLCAENELGIGEESEDIIVLSGEDLDLGSEIVSALNLDDTVFELGITPNRPDCLSVLGVARELSCFLNRKLKIPENSYEIINEEESGLTAEILDIVKCPRYACRYIKNIIIDKSPRWLRQRLEACDVRSINNVVDITNYVMLEYGHPLHAFDSRFVTDMKIVVRQANEGEIINSLDSIERKLNSEDLLICDDSKPIAIAGVIGGENSEVKDDTESIVLECAYFDPITIRKTSKRLKLSTESSYRFERGMDPESIRQVIERASSLMSRYANGTVEKKIIDIYPKPLKQGSVSLNFKKLNSILGTSLKKNKVHRILSSLGFDKLDEKKDESSYKVPTYRVDISRDADLIEEIARVYGYNSIPTTLPMVSVHRGLKLGSRHYVLEKLKKFISSIGFTEVVNYSFFERDSMKMFNDSDPIDIINPISSDQSVMRTTLLPGILQNVVRYLNHQEDKIKIFETGKVYNRNNTEIVESFKLSLVATVKNENDIWEKAEYDFFDIKGVVIDILDFLCIDSEVRFDKGTNTTFLHTGISSTIVIDNENVGVLGELHPDKLSELDINRKIYVLDLELEKVLNISQNTTKTFSPIPKYPFLRRDLSLIVDTQITSAEIINKVYSVDSDLIENVDIFDVYSDNQLSSEGKKSVSISIILRSKDKTLTDDEANIVQSKTLDKLSTTLNAQLRS